MAATSYQEGPWNDLKPPLSLFTPVPRNWEKVS